MSSHSFNELKRSASGSFEKLSQELNKLNSAPPGRDERIWTCQTDKAGNGYAVIRFLPSPAGEEVPFVRMFTHGFKGPTGSWYIENSLTTIGQQDPIAEHNTRLWNSGVESDKEIVRKQKRQLNYYSNIYVVKDPANPENEGKVFLFRYGKKIFDKLNDVMYPQFEDEKPVNPFDLWTGANFKLKIRRVDGYANYDKAEFDSPEPLLDSDEELEAVWKAEYSLQELLDPKHFRSYDELKKRLERALGHGLEGEAPEPKERAFSTPAPEFKSSEPKQQAEASSDSLDEDEDDDMAFFKGLAEED